MRLWMDAHASVGLEATMFGCYEPESMGRLLSLASKVSGDAPTFFDVGANIGFYSIGFALAQTNARVIAFEPGPAAATLCARNIDAVADRLQQRHSSIELVRAAVSDKTGEATFTVSSDAGHSSLVEVENFQPATITVKTVSGDQVAARTANRPRRCLQNRRGRS